MIRPRVKSVLLGILYLGIVVSLLSPLFMYFSHDVEKLTDNYPHNIQKNLDQIPEYEIKKATPAHWVKLRSISKYVKWAIVLSEDWDFYNHDGIDIEQIKIAIDDMLDGKRFRGASTISQQMIKNIFLTQKKSLWRKIHEMILTQKVEKVLSKDRILEVYLNCIEFGPGIYGVEQASLHYFKKGPSHLSPKEGAYLAMLLPSPKRYYISFKKKKLTHYASTRIKAILVKMRMGKVISSEEYLEQLGTRLAWERSVF